jgi:drug/metabolite transporter (DMT)-like permease
MMNFFLLILASALWGAAPTILKPIVLTLGAAWTAELRILLAVAFAAVVLHLFGRNGVQFRTHGRFFLVAGALNTALPYLLNSFAVSQARASLVAALGATAPLFALFIRAMLVESVAAIREWVGLVLGFIGTIVLLSGSLDPTVGTPPIAIAMGLGAAISVAAAAIYIGDRTKVIGPLQTVVGTLLAASLLTMPSALMAPVPMIPSIDVISLLALLSIVCTIIPYHIYFRLVDQAGPAFALLVNYLIPAFGVAWGVVLLGEDFGITEIAGLVLVLCGIGVATIHRTVGSDAD